MHLFQFLTPGRWELFNREKLSSFLSLGGAILQYTFDENKLNNYSLDKRQLKVCKISCGGTYIYGGTVYFGLPWPCLGLPSTLDCLHDHRTGPDLSCFSIYFRFVLSVCPCDGLSWLYTSAFYRTLNTPTRRDRIKNIDIRETLQQKETMVDKIKIRWLIWFGHMSRMDERSLPSRAMYCYIKGRRKRGRPPKKWIDNIKDDVKLMELSIGGAVNLTRDREKWRIVSWQAHRQP